MIAGHILVFLGLSILASMLCLTLLYRNHLRKTVQIFATLMVVCTTLLMYHGLKSIYGWPHPTELPDGKKILISFIANEEKGHIYLWLISRSNSDDTIEELKGLIDTRQPRSISIQYDKELHKQLEKLKEMSGGNPIAIDIKTLIGKEQEGEFTLGGEQKQYILPDVKIQPK